MYLHLSFCVSIIVWQFNKKFTGWSHSQCIYAQYTEKQLTGLRFILKRSYSCITQIEKKVYISINNDTHCTPITIVVYVPPKFDTLSIKYAYFG